MRTHVKITGPIEVRNRDKWDKKYLKNNTIYSVISVGPLSTNWEWILSNRPLMVTCATPCQTAPTATRSSFALCTGGAGATHLWLGPRRVSWERDQGRLSARKARGLRLRCWEFTVPSVAWHCSTRTTSQRHPPPVVEVEGD